LEKKLDFNGFAVVGSKTVFWQTSAPKTTGGVHWDFPSATRTTQQNKNTADFTLFKTGSRKEKKKKNRTGPLLQLPFSHKAFPSVRFVFSKQPGPSHIEKACWRLRGSSHTSSFRIKRGVYLPRRQIKPGETHSPARFRELIGALTGTCEKKNNFVFPN